MLYQHRLSRQMAHQYCAYTVTLGDTRKLRIDCTS